jgi:catechol 2,3-dioxygenase-like lactoylglutathione lyase family enzyme
MSDLSGIHHTGLHVRDLARSVAFYRDLLGLQVLAEREGRADYVGEILAHPGATIRMAWLRHPDGGPILELLQYVDPAGTPVDTAPPNPGTAHVALSVYWIVRSGSPQSARCPDPSSAAAALLMRPAKRTPRQRGSRAAGPSP